MPPTLLPPVVLEGQRTKEIGIRMALGGQVRDVVRLVLREGMGLTAVALVIGGAGAVAVGRVLDGFLYGVKGSDSKMFLVSIPALLLVALVTTLFPARRAARVSPVVAIRSDHSR
jgi:ABC-type antimicrobial peptide transport system permease subunit